MVGFIILSYFNDQKTTVMLFGPSDTYDTPPLDLNENENENENENVP